ncbi:MAG: ImmA/IrrE family metallo-endopeptidase [Phycisphaerae bacterium]|nr:ImmA/IrrE family metallo-endopeptidase [Phycisphaerae bacterium]
MSIKVDLARTAYQAAIQERTRAGVSPSDTVCVVDLVQKRDVEVRFYDIPSMEGMYYHDGDSRPLILVSSCRPRGRRAFNCAHEYGHHVFNHGNRVDEVINSTQKAWDKDEFLADCFAGYLLMPKLAVSRLFTERGWKPDTCTPEQIFTVAGQLGVGYESLLIHMTQALKILSLTRCKDLRTVTPKQIKQNLIGFDNTGEVVTVDEFWIHKPVDLCVGDLIVLPTGTMVEGSNLRPLAQNRENCIFEAAFPGLARAYSKITNWATHIRIAKIKFEGLAKYRHFPEIDNE